MAINQKTEIEVEFFHQTLVEQLIYHLTSLPLRKIRMDGYP